MSKKYYYVIIHWTVLNILTVGLVLSFVISEFAENVLLHNKQVLLKKELEKFEKIIDLKINTYQTVLNNIRSTYIAHAQDDVNHFNIQHFDRYIRAIQTDERIDSLKTVVFYRKINNTEQDKSNFLQFIKKNYATNTPYASYYQQYKIFPLSKREAILPVELVAPFDNNKGSLGYDVFFEANRNEAINYAIQYGFSISSRILLVHRKEESVLLFVPIYKNIDLPKDQNKTIHHIDGIIGSAFNVKQFFNEVLNISVFKTQGFLRVTDITHHNNTILYQDIHFDNIMAHSRQDYLYVDDIQKIGGRKWKIELLVSADNNILFDKLYQYGPKITLVISIILTLIIFILQIRNRQLYESDSRFKRLTRISPLAMAVTELNKNQVILFNQKACELFQCTFNQVKTIDPSIFYVDIEQRQHMMELLETYKEVQNIEIKFRRFNGSEFWSLCSATLTHFESKKAVLISFIDITNRKELEHKLFELATTDSLTNILNRRHFLEESRNVIQKEYQNSFQNISLIMLDIDFFKRINDTYGHDSGDIVICGVVNVIKSHIQSKEILFGRLGGEEFALLLPEFSEEKCIEFAELIRQAVENYAFNFESIHQYDIHVTISLGLVTLNETHFTNNQVTELYSIERMITSADEALYQAKHSGRNQVQVNTLK